MFAEAGMSRSTEGRVLEIAVCEVEASRVWIGRAYMDSGMRESKRKNRVDERQCMI